MNVKSLLILTILFSFLLVVGISRANVAAPTFQIYIGNTGSLGFQNQMEYNVTLTVSSGALNCSNASLSMDLNHGRLVFMNNESAAFTTIFSVSRLTINGGLVESGVSTSQVQNDVTIIEWWIMIEPWVPYLFILGMIGLGSMFGGSLYTVHLFKKREYQWALVQGVTFIAVGFGLFIAWVFA